MMVLNERLNGWPTFVRTIVSKSRAQTARWFNYYAPSGRAVGGEAESKLQSIHGKHKHTTRTDWEAHSRHFSDLSSVMVNTAL